MTPTIVIVGGFLGAGKTTLLLAAARQLEQRGLRSALILNDQGGGLVDTEYARLHGISNGEVTGGCFCCRFSELVRVMDTLREHSPDVIFAEPVGSCTDISATILQPLREYSTSYRLAPYTVLVDPTRASELLGSEADENMAFLFQKQVQEADILCFSKSDLNAEGPRIPAAHVRHVSGKSGQGVAAWLDEVLGGGLSAGSHILEIDYEQYARAEAALAWLNLHVEIQLSTPRSSAMILGPLLEKLDADFSAANISIVHLKAIMNSPEGYLKAAMCGNGEQPVVEGALSASPGVRHDLLLNLRAVGSDVQVREIVEKNVKTIQGTLAEMELACFHPAPPKPERRIASVS